jgi:carbamoyltransferase
MNILGINAYHGDAAACLVRDGKIVAAAEEERFRRIKHWAGFPSEAIRYCLCEAGLKLADIDHVAINSDPKAHILRRVGYALSRKIDVGLILDRIRNQRKRISVVSELESVIPGERFRGTVHRIEHHLAHLASCFFVSPFREAVAVSVDGFGDFASAGWGVGRGQTLTIDGRVWFPHSLGVFYQAMTQFIGFPSYGDEYKVMGLAPYGKPSFLDEMRRIVRLADDGTFALDLEYFRHHKERISYSWDGGPPVFGALYSDALAELLGPRRPAEAPLEARHHDIACSAQAMYEEAFFSLLNHLHSQYRIDDLVLAGGCAMNSVANGKVRRSTPFRRVYVQAAAGDAGGAIGAAYVVENRLGGDRAFVMDHAYLGPGFDSADVARLLSEREGQIAEAGCAVETITDQPALCRQTAAAIADGKVVGWFQGRMEWGPRALGNRSILCDPRRADMKAILNAKIKRRESFRPFAPSILEEAVSEWFEENDAVPFMMQVFQIQECKRSQIPAVTHVDGSGRLQTVSRSTNPRYYQLIDSFRQLSGIPMVLNTSFNENEPVVCEPKQALDCFLRTRMDVIVLGDVMLTRNGKS